MLRVMFSLVKFSLRISPRSGLIAPCFELQKSQDFAERPMDLFSKSLSSSGRDETIHKRGLVPPGVRSVETQIQAVIENLSFYKTDLNKYLFLRELQDYDEKLFYRVLLEFTEDIMPLVYTPTVGEACLKYSLIFRKPRGLFITIEDKGNIYSVLGNWPHTDIEAVVVTDGERILGLGDLGSNGMGIPVGKLALYTALAGIPPSKTLPITVDVGTNNEKNLADNYYIGLRHKRIGGPEYDALFDEFMEAVVKRFGRKCLIQFEDFANHNAFRLLTKYRDRYCMFNDDIQGTAAVAVAGLLASMRITKTKLSENKILFVGAGGAALGIADLLVMAMNKEGTSIEDARNRIWMLDADGLICKSRKDCADSNESHKAYYAKDFRHLTDLPEIVDTVKPTILIGASAQGGLFTPDILKSVAKNATRPVIFALSNPTHKSECTAAEAYFNTDGRCVFASGSPFPPYKLKNKSFYPGQGNNAYIFPGIALAVISCKATHISDEVFLIAAQSLSEQVKKEHLAEGRVYPPLSSIHDVSLNMAIKLLEYFYKNGYATLQPEPQDKRLFLKGKRYDIF